MQGCPRSTHTDAEADATHPPPPDRLGILMAPNLRPQSPKRLQAPKGTQRNRRLVAAASDAHNWIRALEPTTTKDLQVATSMQTLTEMDTRQSGESCLGELLGLGLPPLGRFGELESRRLDESLDALDALGLNAGLDVDVQLFAEAACSSAAVAVAVAVDAVDVTRVRGRSPRGRHDGGAAVVRKRPHKHSRKASRQQVHELQLMVNDMQTQVDGAAAEIRQLAQLVGQFARQRQQEQQQQREIHLDVHTQQRHLQTQIQHEHEHEQFERQRQQMQQQTLALEQETFMY